jgi:prophage tail gpP-like protein
MDPTGTLVVGKPNMNQAASGRMVLSKSNRNSTNVFSMRTVRSAATIPNILIPIYSGQEIAGVRPYLSKAIKNNAEGPKRLWKANHKVLKTVVSSFPSAESPQDAAALNVLVEANRQELGDLVKLQALREMAKFNVKELIVQAVVPGHYNESAKVYSVDQMYTIEFDRGGIIGRDMYLYSVRWALSEDTGQRTTLQFCKQGTIVAQNKVKTK